MKYKAGFPVEFLGSSSPSTFISSIIHPDDYMPFCEVVNGVIDGRSKQINTHSRLNLNGEFRWYYISASPERSDENSTEFLGIMHDVSEYLECDVEDAVIKNFKSRLNRTFENGKEPPSLADILGEEYLQMIQEPFTRVKGLYSAIVSPSGNIIANANGQPKNFNINKISYQRKKSIRIKHKTVAEWIIASESLSDINDNSPMLDIMVQTVSSIANSYVVIGEEVENNQNANKLLGENFEDQMLINSIYTTILKYQTSAEAFRIIIPLVKDYFAFDRIIFCIDKEKPVKVYHWDDNGVIIPVATDFTPNEKVNEELNNSSIVCVDEDEVRGEKSEHNRSCALSRIYENGSTKGVFMFISHSSGRIWTNRERKVLRSITQVLTTLIYSSFTENKLALFQEQLKRLAFRDAATGIPNRTAFEKDFAEAIQEEKSGAVVSFEIANYKTMTELYGCQFADSIVGSIAEYIAAIPSCNPTSVYQFSSDILFVIIDGANNDAALGFAKTVLAKFSTSWFFESTEHQIEMYSGVNFFPDDVYTAEECENAASGMLRLAKSKKLRDAVCYSSDIEQKLDENIRIRKMVIEDSKNGFNGYYYLFAPTVDINTGELTCCESRLFWKKDEFIASRDKIIPIIERLGLSVELYEYAFDRICSFSERVRGMGYPNFRVSFQYPESALNSDEYIVLTKRILEKHNLPPSAISISISESSGTLAKNSINLKQLSKLGVNIICEDKGRSFLTETLFKTPYINVAKINAKRLHGDEISAGYLKSLIEKAHESGMKVCVTGVDNEKTRELAKHFNADLIQGIINGRPLHSVDFIKKLNGEPIY